MNERKPKESSWDEFKIGFFDGGFKFQPRQSTTCLTDGLQYLQGTYETGMKMIENKSMEGMDDFNFED